MEQSNKHDHHHDIIIDRSVAVYGNPVEHLYLTIFMESHSSLVKTTPPYLSIWFPS